MPASAPAAPLRANAERTMRAILAAAERVLSEDPGASLGEIAEQAGVARATIHRRFLTRERLLESMATFAFEQVDHAIDAGRPDTAPAAVALHQVTANIIEVKTGWRYALSAQLTPDSPPAQVRARIFDKGMRLLRRAQAAGLIRPEVDLGWAQRVYHALIEQALQERQTSRASPDALAQTVVDTLLIGLGPR